MRYRPHRWRPRPFRRLSDVEIVRAMEQGLLKALRRNRQFRGISGALGQSHVDFRAPTSREQIEIGMASLEARLPLRLRSRLLMAPIGVESRAIDVRGLKVRYIKAFDIHQDLVLYRFDVMVA